MNNETLIKMHSQIRNLFGAIYDENWSHILPRKPKLEIFSYGEDCGYFDDEEWKVTIIIWPHTWCENMWLEIADTLNHELTHALQYATGKKMDRPRDYHSRFFKTVNRETFEQLREEWS